MKSVENYFIDNFKPTANWSHDCATILRVDPKQASRLLPKMI